ncbi:universal stress protein [Sphingobium mellinum]|uniref:universal stress protein n=1 Tax=Sphingobium mellinum TaxID=1387166 RepID=UPI0030EE8AE8
MKSILLHVHDDLGLESRLRAACDIARATNGHIHCVQISAMPDFVAADMYGGAGLAPEMLADLDEMDETVRLRTQERLTREGVGWDWRHLRADTVRGLLASAGLSDLLVVTLPHGPRKDYRDPEPIAAELVLASRVPVMAVPQDARALDVPGRALVAWDGSEESSTALRLALPLLKLADDVHVVTVAEEGKPVFPATDPVEYLSRHGIKSELHSWPREGRTVDAALNAAIAALKPDWMAMGAFGHSRLRQFVLGGVTRTMLRQADLPLLLAH